jgi:hypothetical protein
MIWKMNSWHTISRANHENELNQLKNDLCDIKIEEFDESNKKNKNLQLKFKDSQEFVLGSSKENLEEKPRRATKREAVTGKIDLSSNKTSKFSSKDNQEKALTISKDMYYLK